MAIYEVDDELSLIIVEQRFRDKFITANPGEFTAGVSKGKTKPPPLFFVCVPQMRHRHAKVVANAHEGAWWMMDKPTEASAGNARDRAGQQCAVCSKLDSEVEESGCGYDPKKHR